MCVKHQPCNSLSHTSNEIWPSPAVVVNMRYARMSVRLNVRRRDFSQHSCSHTHTSHCCFPTFSDRLMANPYEYALRCAHVFVLLLFLYYVVLNHSANRHWIAFRSDCAISLYVVPPQFGWWGFLLFAKWYFTSSVRLKFTARLQHWQFARSRQYTWSENRVREWVSCLGKVKFGVEGKVPKQFYHLDIRRERKKYVGHSSIYSSPSSISSVVSPIQIILVYKSVHQHLVLHFCQFDLYKFSCVCVCVSERVRVRGHPRFQYCDFQRRWRLWSSNHHHRHHQFTVNRWWCTQDRPK